MFLIQYNINNGQIHTLGSFYNMADTMKNMVKIVKEIDKSNFYDTNIVFISNENYFNNTNIENAFFSHFRANIDKIINFVVIEILEVDIPSKVA